MSNHLNNVFRIDNKLYCCYISQQEVTDDITPKFIDNHQFGRTNRDVLCVMFVDCTITKIPQGLTKTFPNLRILNIQDSKLKHVCREDLAEYKNLEKIFLDENEIEFLPGDLFDGFKNLKVISFRKNKLQVIEPSLLDCLDKLEAVNFRDNTNYDVYYSMLAGDGSNASLAEIKEQIFEKFFNCSLYFQKNFAFRCQKKIRELTRNQRAFQQAEEQAKANESSFKTQTDQEVRELRRTNEQLRNSLQQERNEKMQLEADLFSQLDKLNINQVGATCSHWEQSQGDSNIFSTDDLIQILRISNRYKYDVLNIKAFNEIRRRFPWINFLDGWADDADKVDEIIGIYAGQGNYESINNNCGNQGKSSGSKS